MDVRNCGLQNGWRPGTPGKKTAIYRQPWSVASICALTNKKDWTDPQRKMMLRAGRVHGLRTLGLVLLVSLLTWGRDRGLWHTYGLRL